MSDDFDDIIAAAGDDFMANALKSEMEDMLRGKGPLAEAMGDDVYVVLPKSFVLDLVASERNLAELYLGVLTGIFPDAEEGTEPFMAIEQFRKLLILNSVSQSLVEIAPAHDVN